MMPKITYQTNKILTEVIISPFEKKKNFEKNAKEFIQQFKKIEKEVLISIERFSGFKWSKKVIPVYLVPQGKFFISNSKSNLKNNLPGVVQTIRDDLERNTHIFIHELSHVNQFQSDFHSKENSFIFDKNGVKNFVNLEICTDVVCVHVLRYLFGNKSSYEKNYWDFMNNVMTSTPGKGKKIPIYLKKWDLNKKTLREYIFKKN